MRNVQPSSKFSLPLRKPQFHHHIVNKVGEVLGKGLVAKGFGKSIKDFELLLMVCGKLF